MTLSLSLQSGGGDGGSIPGRYDLVDIKRSISSGNDRGHYRAFDHNSMGWGEKVGYDDSEMKVAVAENCAITQATLKFPVACRFGYLFNKDALIAALVNKSLEPQFKHIRKIKDVHDATLTTNPAYSDAPKGAEVLDSARDCHFICPVTQLPMNGKYKFVLIKTTKTVLSERGLKETASKNEAGEKLCPITSMPYVDEDVILLHQHLHDAEKLDEEHKILMKTIEKEETKKSKKKKAKREDPEVDGAEEAGPGKKMKADPSSTIKEKSKSAVYSSLFRSKKDAKEMVSAEDLLMKAPGAKINFKL
jgi:hypothetical protein